MIYHGCGNVQAIFEDYIETGIDAYNPLEVKAGMDALDLRRRYGHRIGFCGNSDIQVWERGDREAIRREVLRKLNAAQGGGFIFQSDHSVTSAVSGQTYDYIVKLVREYGRYPLEPRRVRGGRVTHAHAIAFHAGEPSKGLGRCAPSTQRIDGRRRIVPLQECSRP